ncbi:hypothetical protein DPMN_171300 [Dreissena polymorpha]|uniref:Uncharacterized protein n=1 Tax=Dreissena polymorpha TaxID=45954 RepID=A0A9D4E032_DREPO|nr:hypothetical protein DPMN_171300 [Dreissena polymorpha]
MKKHLYVDNIISSFSDEKAVLLYFRDARDLMSKAGFNLQAWASNSAKLLKEISRIRKRLGLKIDYKSVGYELEHVGRRLGIFCHLHQSDTTKGYQTRDFTTDVTNI